VNAGVGVERGGLEEPVAISALEHWSYCPRQCGLIHVEQTFDENYYTIKGHLAHERADSGKVTTERGVRVYRDVPVWSDSLGLVGKLDVLEIRDGVPFPVEYKSGAERDWSHEAIQVCAQAMCLEEMLGQEIPAGAISYLASRRRRDVVFDAALRGAVVQSAEAVREMLRGERLPPAVNDARCRKCSLLDSCLPGVLVNPTRLKLLRGAIFRVDDGSE
jgi:CRISPR-associated exonuclease Cas4